MLSNNMAIDCSYHAIGASGNRKCHTIEWMARLGLWLQATLEFELL